MDDSRRNFEDAKLFWNSFDGIGNQISPNFGTVTRRPHFEDIKAIA